MKLFVFVERAKKGQKGPKRAKKGQKGPKRAKKGQKGPKRAKKGWQRPSNVDQSLAMDHSLVSCIVSTDIVPNQFPQVLDYSWLTNERLGRENLLKGKAQYS